VSENDDALRTRVVASAIHLHAERSRFATGLASVL